MLYPIVLELNGRDVLVVGGGNVAERKIRRLIEAEAKVRVIAIEPNPAVREMAERGEIALEVGPFDAEMVGRPTLVFAATDDPETNDAIVRAGRERGALGNSAAGVSLDFIVPAIGRAEGLGLAVWSRNPALSARLRDELLAIVDERWRLGGRVFESLRIRLEGRGDAQSRGAFWRNLAAGVPGEFRTPALAKRFLRAVAKEAGLPLGRAEVDALFDD